MKHPKELGPRQPIHESDGIVTGTMTGKSGGIHDVTHCSHCGETMTSPWTQCRTCGVIAGKHEHVIVGADGEDRRVVAGFRDPATGYIDIGTVWTPAGIERAISDATKQRRRALTTTGGR